MKKELNEIQLQMIDIAKLSGQRYPSMEIKMRCPWCGKHTLLLKERGGHYWCLKCKREGPLDEVEFKMYDGMVREPKGVAL